MKRRGIALLCLLSLCCSLCLTRTAAADNPYFIAINDNLPDLSAEIMPILVQGITYIPCTLFDRRIAGASLNVFYGQDLTSGTTTLYARDKLLEFNIEAGTAYDYSGATTYDYQAVIKNGLTYVPAAAVCRYFGLGCSFLTTNSGSILRIKNETAVLNDSMFVSSAEGILNSRKNQYQQGQNPSQPTPPPTPTPAQPQEPTTTKPQTGTEIPEETEEVGSGIRVSLGIRVEGASDLSGLLASLRTKRTKAVFFFHPEDLLQYDAVVRQIAGEGHRIGLIPTNLREESIRKGNELLRHILRQTTPFILGDGTVETRDLWEKRGYLCWSPTTLAEYYGETTRFYASVTDALRSRKYSARVLLDDRVSAAAMGELLNQLQGSGYQLQNPRETEF